MTASAGPECVSPPGLVAWWPMEGTLKDTQGTNDGRLLGPAAFAPGEVGQAFQFDSATDLFRVLKSSAIDVGRWGEGLTMELWINPSVVSFQQPLLEWNDNQGNIGTLFWIAVDLEGGGNGSLFASMIDTSGISHQFSSKPGLIAINRFQHVAVTYDKTSGIARLFYNGQMVKEQTLGVVTPQTGYDLYMGYRPSGTASRNRFYGLMDEVSLYNRALEPAEIQSIFAVGTTGKCTKPVLTVLPESRSAFVGQSTTFEVVAVGAEPMTYRWNKDGAAIAGATNATLVLTNLQMTDAGRYDVLVINHLGVAISPAVLLTVDTAGSPGTVVVPNAFATKEDDGWGAMLSTAPSLRMQEVFGASQFPAFPVLITEMRLRRNAGVAPFVGGIERIRLTLSTTAKIPDGLERDFAMNLGTNATEVYSGPLQVASSEVASDGHPNPFDIRIAFAKPFVYDPAAGNLLVESRTSSSIAEAITDGSNELDDQASRIFSMDENAIRAAWTDTGCDIIQFTYRSLEPTLAILPAGGSFTNSVTVVVVTGIPDGVTRYTLTGEDPAVSSPRFPAELVLTQTTILKARVFVGGTPATEIVTALFTKVVPPPRIVAQPSTLSVAEGDDVRFSVTAEGVGPLAYQWRFEGADMVGATNAELNLRSIRLDQAGSYSVRVSNPGGEVVSAGAMLVVRARELFVRVTDSDVVRGGSGFQGSGWADYDGDGDLDLFVCSLTAGGILYRNDGGGVLTKTTGVLPIPAGASQGCAWGDYDNDGYPDLFVANRDGRNNFLFHNRGNGTFERITTGVIVNDGGDSLACAWADYDRDGFLDLFVADLTGKNRLYHNEGNGTFTKVTTGEIVNDMANTVGCAWGDYDNDGYPDLFVANGGNNDNALYHNLGNGTFKKITTGSMVHDGGYSVGCAWGDYNNDGWLDLFVANRLGKNFLYRNNGDGTFTRGTEGAIVNDVGDSNGAAWADYDNDGFLDLFVAKQGTNLLYRNRGDGTFEKITGEPATASPNQGYAAAWGDYDKDGFVDLFVSDFGGANSQLYHNRGNGNAWITVGCEGVKSNKSGVGARVKVKTVVNGSERWQIREITSGDGWRNNGPYANFGLASAGIIDTVQIEWPSGTVQVLRNVAVNQMLVITEAWPGLVIRPDGGSFTNSVTVVAVSGISDGVTRYTLNGGDPVTSSPRFPAELVLTETTILKARVFVGETPATETVTALFTKVVPPPRIIAPPSSQSVEVGGDVRFSVTAAGAEPLSYQWLWQGAAMAGATNRELVLKSVRQEQAGTYSVRVSNAGGETVSNSAVLLVAPQELFAVVTGSDVTKGPGGFPGSGWADSDGDGDLDLFVCSALDGGFLYHNDGAGVLTKMPGVVPIPAGASEGCAWGDYDNDGYPDLFVVNADVRNHFLFHNLGDGRFENITNVAPVQNGGDSVSCAWVDYDRDGFLDLFVPGRNGWNRLYHNERNGTFAEITASVIITDHANGVGCAWGDYDNDGYPDLFMASGGNNVNALYHNERDGTFRRITTGSIAHDVGCSGGGAWGDYNNDGWLDLFVPNQSGVNFLYRNNGDGMFTRITEGKIATDTGFSSGAAWADYDNDGFLDLFVTHQGGNLLYRNRGDGNFESITASPTVMSSNIGYAAAWSDFDQDGHVDLFVPDFAGADNRLYHNLGNANPWITIRCVGFRSNRGGIGARVKVKTVVNGIPRWQIRDISSGDGRRDNGPYANFGLGSAVVIDTVEVDWPSGAVQVLRNVAINQMLLIKETSADLMIQPDDGDYNHVIEITMFTSVAEGVIHYTLDGTGPTTQSAAYQRPFRLDKSASVKARVYVRGEPASETRTATYSIVLTSPEIVSQPDSRNAVVGETVSFQVIAQGTPPMVYEWFHDQQPIAGAASWLLTLTNVQPQDAGTYFVKVSNPLGYFKSDTVSLTIDSTSAGPSIVQGLKDQKVPAGGAAWFGIVVSGTEPITYQWFRNSMPLQGATGSSLVLTNVQPSDAGLYAVLVTNLVKGVWSRAELVVTGDALPPSLAVAPYHVWASPGAPVTFRVALAGGTLPVTYEWRFNGRVVPGAAEPALSFPSVSLADAGTYTVTVSNSGGSVTTEGAVLDVSDYDAGGLVIFENHLASYGLDAPVFDSDGVTRLAGSAFLAQLYGGTNGAGNLAPAGGAVPFKTGQWAGYIQAGVSAKRVIPGVRPGDPATVQIRVWEASKGTTYEQALAAGGKVGQSQRLTLVTGGNSLGTPIPVLSGLTKFSIGLPRSQPAVFISSPAPGSFRDERVTLAGFITNYAPVVSARWEVDGQPMGGLAVTNNRFSLPGLLLHRGENRFRVIATDTEGNEGAAEVAVIWEPVRSLSVTGGQELQEGKRLTFVVALTSQGDVGGLTFALPYDPRYLSDPDFVWAESLAVGMKNVNLASGQVKASVAMFGSAIPAGAQTLGTLTFRARSVPARESVSIEPEVLNVANQAGDKLAFGTDATPGSAIILPRRIKGDNNANDVLDIGDGVLIQRMLMGLDEVRPWDVPGNDVNLSADLDVGDMIKVLRAVVGIDPQPSLPAGAASGPNQRVALHGEGSLADSALLMADKPKAQPGEVVTLQVAFSGLPHPVRGASFTVKYPAEALRLLEAQPPQKGSIVPSAAPVMWHVKGGYAAQAGEVRAAILDAASWPSANGVVAELKFQVLSVAAILPVRSIGLEEVVVTETGYDQELLAARTLGIEIIPPSVGEVAFREGRLEFSLHGAAGASCRVETSTDLEHWDTVETVMNTTGDVRYQAPELPGSNVRFFRFRME